MRSKLLCLLMVFGLLLASFGTALAQEKPEPFCGNLSDEDCAILQSAQEAMMKVSSYQSTGTYDVTLNGIPGLPADQIAVNLTAEGAFAMSPDAMAAAQSVAGFTQAEVQQLLADDPQVLVDLVNGWSFDLTLDVKVTPELADLLSAQAGGITIPDTLSVGLIMVDGVLYVDLTNIAPLVAGVPEGWVGIPLGEVVSAAADQGAFAQAAAQMDPSAMAASGMDPASAATLMAVQSTLGDPKAFEKFLTIERLDDVEVDGQPAAVFETKFDAAAFVSSPEFADLVKMAAAAGALGETAPSAAEIDQTLSMLGMMGPMLFQGLNISSSVTVGLDDSYIYGDSSTFAWDLSSLLQMAAMSGQLPEGLDASNPIAFDFSTKVANSDFNGEQTIEAPADAMLIPAESMMMAH